MCIDLSKQVNWMSDEEWEGNIHKVSFTNTYKYLYTKYLLIAKGKSNIE